MNDFTDEGLEKRQKSCERFTTKASTRDYTPTDSKEGFTKLALDYYCWDIINDIEGRCLLVQVRHKLGAHEQLLAAFKDKIDSAGRKPIAWHLRCDLTKAIILKRILAKEERTKKKALMQACSIVIDTLDKPGVHIDEKWLDYYEMCMKINSSS